MANYYATIRTNYFSVKDETAFRELIEAISAEDEVHLFEKPQSDGSIKFGFGCYGNIYGLPAENEEDACEDDMDCFYDALQQMVCDDDAIIITEIGSEKLRYLVGTSTVITHSEINYMDLCHSSLELAEKMLGNSSFQTQMDY